MVSRLKIPLYVYFGSLFLVVLIIGVGAIILVEYRQTKAIALTDASTLFQHIGEETRGAVEVIYDRAMLTTDLLASTQLVDAETLDDRVKSMPFVLATLRADPSLSAVYVGYATGEFFLVRRVDAEHAEALTHIPAPPATAFLVQSRARNAAGAVEGSVLFFSGGGWPLGQLPAPDYDFDPRTRPWYQAAEGHRDIQTVAPYVFYTTHEVGATFARRSGDGKAVAAVDVTLDALGEALRRVRPSKTAEITVVNGAGEILADAAGPLAVKIDPNGTARLPRAADADRPALAALAGAIHDDTLGNHTLSIADRPWRSYVSRFDLPGEPLYFAMAMPQAELLLQTRRARNFGLAVGLAILIPLIPLTILVSQLAARPLRALTRDAEAIKRLDFGRTKARRSSVAEIDQLADAMAAMRATIRQFIEIGTALAGERRFDRLLERILAETARVAAARGGAVYLAEPDGRLTRAVAAFDEQPLAQPDLHPIADAEHPAMRGAAGRSLKLTMTPAELARWHPDLACDAPLLVLAIPLRDRRDGLAGVLVLFQEPSSFAEAAEDDVLALVEAVSGNVAVAIETRRLNEEQKQLLGAVIELVASAIDAKSPYTAQHCQRVPQLAAMITKAAVEARDGPFADFALTETQWEELHLAAWLHDCGKILTPEYVVDKATKLETIYDRLHEIRTRFEVVKREAEVACWRAIADGADRTERLAALAETWATLDEEFAFIAACNNGGEGMGPERIARIRRIAERRWTRTLDDRIGLSFDESARKDRVPPPTLPVEEPLLADRPDHLIERPERDRFQLDNPWGIRMAVPERLYDRGEIYNLSIERGTLTAEERFKINQHVIDTIRMLSSLPLPRHLRNAVEIAGGHHERIDGTGYPRRLTGDRMSLLARILAVADVFEALTAGDRPYKRRMRLSEALAILARMRDDGHIDRDVFELFLSAGIYRDYAERFLVPEQVDEIELGRYREPRAAA
ncbi:metal-dependent phosphohydrolase [Aliidongia dinghuensis]|uniref:Metal-dependent phosphohydrolase n=1 Tax=Aliidongia dinghuensis TaxID=1867774 RepID=A0A8J3E1M8_9PROT|nr:HD domain-containing phosphohydrolase [Aliidongia dinghuensis]GGF03462.1 metal-dependent phosphohydrolase [Aliidongia dinghuensis]